MAFLLVLDYVQYLLPLGKKNKRPTAKITCGVETCECVELTTTVAGDFAPARLFVFLYYPSADGENSRSLRWCGCLRGCLKSQITSPWGGEGRGRMSEVKKFEISGEGFEGFF